MKVYVYAADEYGCGHYRMIWPGESARAAGLDVVIRRPSEARELAAVVRGNTIIGVHAPEDADVIVLQRPANGMLVRCIPHLQANGIAVVVDVDDDLSHIHPANPAFKGMHPKVNPENNWQWIERACQVASLVTVSTPALEQVYGSHGRVRLLRNLVPFGVISPPRPAETFRLGWPGSLHSHPDDLRAARGLARRVTRVGFRVIGDPVGVAREIGVHDDLVTGTDLVPFGKWLPTVAQLELGVAPLADTRFNVAKSWLKPLELCAAGVPWIASATPEYTRLAAYGAGMVAAKNGWDKALSVALSASDQELDEQRLIGYDVARLLTYEEHGHLWAEAWSDAAQRLREKTTISDALRS
jgi:hypothetical protein